MLPNRLKNGSTGTVNENNSDIPFVIWDGYGEWAIKEEWAELIEEQTVNEACTIEEFLNKEIERLHIELNNKQSRIDWLEGNLAAYKHIIEKGMGVNKHE